MPVRRASISQLLAVPLSTVPPTRIWERVPWQPRAPAQVNSSNALAAASEVKTWRLAGVRQSRGLVVDVLAERYGRSDTGSSHVDNTVDLASGGLVEVTTGQLSRGVTMGNLGDDAATRAGPVLGTGGRALRMTAEAVVAQQVRLSCCDDSCVLLTVVHGVAVVAVANQVGGCDHRGMPEKRPRSKQSSSSFSYLHL